MLVTCSVIGQLASVTVVLLLISASTTVDLRRHRSLFNFFLSNLAL